MTARLAALLLVFLTGVTGLIYEVTWHRYLTNLLGSQSRAAAIILAVFLGGLAVGYRLFGSYSRRAARPVFVCGLVEIGIGIWALLFPTLYRSLWASVGVSSGNYIADIAVAIALLGPPTILMGGTLPLLTQGLALDLDEAPRFHAAIYAMNTGGAFLGCVLAGFFLLPQFGLQTTLFLAAPINLLAGIILCGIAPKTAATTSLADNPRGRVPFSRLRALGIAFLAGFISIALQVTFMRLIGLSMGSSEYAFSMIVAVFVLMLAIGAWLIAGRSKVSLWLNQLGVVLGLFLIYHSVSYWPFWSHVVRTLFTSVEPSFYLYHGAIFLLLTLLLVLPLGAMGAALPLLFRDTRDRFGDLGAVVGVLYGINAAGCVLGALLGGQVLLNYMNLDSVFRVCLALSIVSLALAARSRTRAVGTAAAALIVALGTPQWDKQFFAAGLFRNRETLESSYRGREALYHELFSERKIVAYRDGPNTTVSVVEFPHEWKNEFGTTFERSLYVNGKSDGATSEGDLRTTRMLAHLPALFQRSAARQVAVVGFGTGITAGALTLYPQFEHVDVIEIAPVVREVAPHFDFANHNARNNPKVRWHLADAYRVLSSTDERYAAIISEPSNPWVTGVERLYAKEFYSIARTKLAPGGIYAQWFHTYSLLQETLALVIRTFQSEFPHVRAFSFSSDLILLGSESPIESADEARTLLNSSPQLQKELTGVGITSMPGLLSFELPLPRVPFAQGPIHTLEFPRLGFRAGRDFFLGEDVAVDEMLDSPFARPWSYQVTTLAEGDPRFPAVDFLREFAKGVCVRVEFYEAWREAPKACGRALVALAVHGALDPQSEFSAESVVLLRNLVGGTAQPAKSIDEARQNLELYTTWASEFLRATPAALRSHVSACFSATDSSAALCRAELIEALAFTGYPADAQGLWQIFAGELPAKTRARVDRIVRESARAALENRG